MHQISFHIRRFLLLMRAKGYEIKGESFEENAAKYISFRPLDKERFVRGSAKSLGKEYTKNISGNNLYKLYSMSTHFIV